MRSLLFIFFLVFVQLSAQDKPTEKKRTPITQDDSLVINSGKNDSLQVFNPTINDYLFRTEFSKPQIFDTVFSYNKTYQFSQYTNQDSFGKLQMANVGSGYNSLVHSWSSDHDLSLMPTNKSYGILTANKINYYDVKTPTTAFVFHNGVKNGAALYSNYTQNIGKRFNFAINYFGLRSQGAYQSSLAVNNNTIFSAHYLSKNSKYELFAHYIHQNVTNQENGGISPEYDLLYQEGNSEIKNRQTIPVNWTNAQSRLAYRRYYLSHQFSPFNVEKFPFKINHTFQHQSNKYYFEFASADLANATGVIPFKSLSSKKFSENLSNTISLLYDAEQFKLKAGAKHQWIQLGTNNEILNGNPALPEYKENRLGVVGNLDYRLSDVLHLQSTAEFSRGNSFGNYLKSENQLFYQPIKDLYLKAHLNYKSSAPGFNYLVNTSPLSNYTFSLSDFKNENILNVGGRLGLKWGKAELIANYFKMENLAYFNSYGISQQYGGGVSITQLGGESTWNYGPVFLNAQLLFQQNLEGEEIMTLPKFIGRANLFYQSKIFDKKAEIQTGIKVYYFSKFASRDFSPVLNEYILANTNSFSIGGQPIADAYFNFKIKRMFFFIEGQHFTTTFSPNKVYTAPHYPFYDFRLNLGIVWYLFS